ncbi:MAG: hypothetical protein LBH84_05035 [Prevotellaceae bacterium]|nr:hypothetical protein [Prevotellaceae bacterium]
MTAVVIKWVGGRIVVGGFAANNNPLSFFPLACAVIPSAARNPRRASPKPPNPQTPKFHIPPFHHFN